MRMRLIVVLLAGMTAWAGPTWARAGGVRESVPFMFGVGGKTFAAGDYVMMARSHQVRVVSQEDGKTLVFAIANDVSVTLRVQPMKNVGEIVFLTAVYALRHIGPTFTETVVQSVADRWSTGQTYSWWK